MAQSEESNENMVRITAAHYNENPPHAAEKTVKLGIYEDKISNGKKNPENSDNFCGNLPVFNRSKTVDYNQLSPSDLIFSVSAKKTSSGDTVVGLPNQTLRNTQSDVDVKKLRSKEKSLVNKERRKGKEKMSYTPITSFFRKEEKDDAK